MPEGRYLPGLTPSGAVRAIASSLSAVGVLWHSQIFQLSEYLSSVVVASADFGGVVGPVAGGGALPCGGDADVDAEHPGEHCGGQVCGQLEQCGGTGGSGVDTDPAKAFGEVSGGDGLSGLTAGKQPGGCSLITEGGVPSSGGDEALDQCVDRFGQHDGLASEAQACVGVAGFDVVEGESADRGGGLRVEDNEQSGDAILRLKVIVVEQPTCLLPACLSVDLTGRSVPTDGGELQGRQLLLVGPADEVACLGRGATAGAGQPSTCGTTC